MLVIFLPTFSNPGDKISVFFTGYVMISCTLSCTLWLRVLSLLIFSAVRDSLTGRDGSIPLIGTFSLTACKVWLFFNSSSTCNDLV